MRKIDKNKNIGAINELSEKRYLTDKGLLSESNETDKIKIIAKIELLQFLNATYEYPKLFKDIHEAYIRELKSNL